MSDDKQSRIRKQWGTLPAANLALDNLEWATSDEPTITDDERLLAAVVGIGYAVLQMAHEIRTMPAPPGYYE